MDKLNGPARLMIVTDLDDTMVDHDDPENTSLLEFNALWESKYKDDSILVFSTGRSPTLYDKLRDEKPELLTPDITIMSVGTKITYGKAMVPDEEWTEILSQKWDSNIVLEETTRFSEIKLQPETEQGPLKISFSVPNEKAEEIANDLSMRLEERKLNVKFIFSTESDKMNIDILPKGAGKGQALAYLLMKFDSIGKPPMNTLVCGDSGNDAELFSIEGVYGVMVRNARVELLQWYEQNAIGNPKIIHASQRCAGGIIEAIQHHFRQDYA